MRNSSLLYVRIESCSLLGHVEGGFVLMFEVTDFPTGGCFGARSGN